MKRSVLPVVCCCILFLIPAIGFADGMADLRESVQTAREKLIVLLNTSDKQKQTKLVEDINLLSRDIDTELAQLLGDKKTSYELREKLTDFKPVWNAFRITRDKELIPRVLTGDSKKIAEAKELARTIQAERFQKMQSLLE